MDGSSSSSSNLEAGVYGSNSIHRPSNHRRGSYRAMPVAAKFFVEVSTDEKPQHFLDGCALCRQPLPPNRDIFMYRGDMPFCSEECRQERIEMDEAMEKRSKPSTSLDSQKKKSSTTNPPKSQSIHVPAGTVVAG